MNNTKYDAYLPRQVRQQSRWAEEEEIKNSPCVQAININKEGFVQYMGLLAKSVGKEKLETADDVIAALIERLEFFAEMGCRASDHGLDYIPFRKGTAEEVNAVYAKVMNGEAITVEEAEVYQTAVLIALGKAYHRLDIAMQLH